ncbi:MAG: twin-arginine translocase TatA/TatE family subunit [Halobacteriovorax sp.]|nr:twin-arginine translocase TatA/TatE family subunit [Halobacteriovorax sp.]|tara:strand:- start:40888 stop:41085 length:198 start_codon:yes stop_codon:yes gene_type:complete
MFGLGMGELVILLVVVLLLFGGKKLPQLGRALGTSINQFKDGLKEGKENQNTADANLEDKTDKDA